MYEQILSFISSLIPTRLEIYIGGRRKSALRLGQASVAFQE